MKNIEPLESLTPGAYLALARDLASDHGNAVPLKLGLLSSNSFSFLEPYLVVECARRNLRVEPRSSEFGQIEQALLPDAADSGASSADALVIALRIEDVVPDAYSHGERLEQAATLCVDRLDKAVDLARSASDAQILVANFAVPGEARAADIFDAGRPQGAAQVVAAANAELAAKLQDKPGVHVWDYDGLVASRGASSWTDQRLWLLARQPIAGPNLPYAAAHLARSIAGTLRAPAKCLVLDLDNTLWGGAAGDEGLEGIRIGDDHPGNAFKRFQYAVAGLAERGVLLAIASKNDEAPVREIFDSHPELVLKWDDFSCHRINWESKSENLQGIANALNISIDALVFFDDNPVEREEVRQNAPGVHVIDVPSSPLGFVEALFADGVFDSGDLSWEDTERTRYYRDESRRQADLEAAGSMEDFLKSLGMRASLGAHGPETAARIAQLIGKTNQFNLTTRRHTQQQLQQLADEPDWDVRWLRLGDRYGDSGLVGVTIVRYRNDVAAIDSFLMSCRVMNRNVEHAMLADIVERAVARGCNTLHGEYLATERNAIVSDFYPANAFAAVGEGAFELDLRKPGSLPAWPEVIERAT